MKQEVSE